MINFSRRQLARYAVAQMTSGQSPSLLARRLAAALIVSKKTKEAEMLLSDIDQELEDRGVIARASITSAHELSESLRRELAAEVKKLTGVKQVITSQNVDRDVLGGIRIETANHAWDKTARKSLRDIQEAV